MWADVAKWQHFPVEAYDIFQTAGREVPKEAETSISVSHVYLTNNISLKIYKMNFIISFL